MKKNKIYRKNKKEMKMIIHLANKNIMKIMKKKKALFQMKQEATIVKTD